MDEREDLVDDFYRPYVRALGNLVVLFAQCEADLLALVDKAKDKIIELIRGLGLSGFDLDELVAGIGRFWCDKEIRNRLIHDDWFPSLEEGELGKVGTRGLMRKKVPEEIINWPSVDEVWDLASRFSEYSYLFSHRVWALSRARRSEADN